MVHASTTAKISIIRIASALSAGAMLLTAAPAFAQSASVVSDALITKIGTYIIDPLLLVIFAAGFFMFMWGLFQFMLNSNSSEDTSEGKRHMIYGTLGMLIMVSVYGIISLLATTFGLNLTNPTVNTNVNVPTASFVGS
jgi:ABC-type phosphate transport system permease subunit